MSQRIIYGATSQSLRHVPPARVTSATYAIEDLTRADDGDADRVVASGSATVASWSVATTAAAGAGTSNAKRITATTTTGATVGAPAAIVAADGSTEIFTVDAVSSSSYVEAETALVGAYPTSSTVYGILITASVPDPLAADEDILEQRRPLRVVWTYTIGGVVIKAQELIEFVRHTTALVDLGAAILRVRALYPDLPERLVGGVTLDSIGPLLADDVADDLRQRKIAPEQFLAGPAGVQLLALRLVAHAGELGYAPASTPTDGVWARLAADRYRQRLESLVIGEPGHATAHTEFTSDTSTETPSPIYRGPTLRM